MARDGDARAAHQRLEDVLVHADRRGEHARADVRDARQLAEPLHGAVLAERPVEDRQHDVDRAERRGRGVGRDGERLRGRGRRQLGAPVAGRERPAAVAADLDRAHVVALGVERGDDRGRRRERDLVLARAPAREHGQPHAAAHGDAASCRSWCRWSCRSAVAVVVSVGGGGGGVTSGGGTNSPIDDRHDRVGHRPASRRAGPGDMTRPSSASSSVSCRVTWTRKPAARSVARASGPACSDTSGTVSVCGPRETESVTGEPRVAVELPGRRLLDDLAGRAVAVDVDAPDREPGGLQLRGRDVVARADDVRHGDGPRAAATR